MGVVLVLDPNRPRPEKPCDCPFCTAVRRSRRQHPSAKGDKR